jgi:hypothetical protein
MALQVQKFNLDLTGTAASNVVNDELYTNVGSATAFVLGHSRFAGSTLNIYTGAGSTGYHLVLNTDYTLGSQDTSLSARAGFAVYATVSIVNPTYQSGNLYISYHVIADVVNANDQYDISLTPGFQYIQQNSNGSISVIADMIALGNSNTTSLTIGVQTIWDNVIGLHLQTASTSILGAVKVDGTTITINGSGVISSSPGVSLVTAGSSTVGVVQYNGLTQAAGQFDGGSTAPSATTRLNYDGNLYVNSLIATTDAVLNGLTVGHGGSSITTNIVVGPTLPANTTGAYNVALGFGALNANTTGSSNVAIGYHTLNTETTASNNTAIGYEAMTANISGNSNVGIGVGAINSSTGSQNTAVGASVGNTLTTGSNNII